MATLFKIKTSDVQKVENYDSSHDVENMKKRLQNKLSEEYDYLFLLHGYLKKQL